MKTIFDIGPVLDRPEPALAGFRATDTGFHWPHMLTGGHCTECPGESTGWVYRVPKTRTRLCKDCLIACAEQGEGTDPVLAALGRELAECRRANETQDGQGKPAAKLLSSNAPEKPLDIADGRFCSDCGRHGPAWKVEATCDQFCLYCAERFIVWQEGELRDGYAAAARLARMPLAEKRPYRLVYRRACYQIAACEAA